MFAALNIATGKVTERCQPRHPHREFLVFLGQVARAYPDSGDGTGLHLVMDNDAAHKREKVREWAAHPRGLHPDPRLVDEHGRDLVLHGPTPNRPPRQLPLRPRPGRRGRNTPSTAGTTASTRSPGP